MTDSERLAMWIANCKICTLAEAMKDCPLCLFRIGLLEREKAEVKDDQNS